MSKYKDKIAPEVDWSIEWWKRRHDKGYFQGMPQHAGWKLYDAMPGWFMEFVKPVPDDVALEIGCGYGEWMAPLSKLVRTVYGVDIHPVLLNAFNQRLGRMPNVHMHLTDGKSIPYPDGGFSIVYSISVFQHMPRATVHGYLKESVRMLMPGGRAAFHFRGADEGTGPYSADIVVDHDKLGRDFSVGWTMDEVSNAMRIANFPEREILDYGQSIIAIGSKK